MTEVLRGDAEDVQAHGGLLELGLQDLQLQVLLLTALPQLLDQRSVQLLGPLSLLGRPPARCKTEIRYLKKNNNNNKSHLPHVAELWMFISTHK